MDLQLERPVTPQWFEGALRQQLPAGIGILQSTPITPTLPSLQSQVRFAEYRVEIPTDKTREEIEEAINQLLALTNLTWQHQRDTGTKTYDLRVLIIKLILLEWNPGKTTIGMKLRCDGNGAGRPEQVAAALGFTGYPESIHRTSLILETGNNTNYR